MTAAETMKKELDIAQHSFAKGIGLGIVLAALPQDQLGLLMRRLALLMVQSETDTPHVKRLLKTLRSEIKRNTM